MIRRARGQAIVELALGLLVLVPLTLFGFYLLEASNEKLVVTGIGSEALWATTAYSHHVYEGADFHSPSAAASAAVSTQAAHPAKSRLFVAEKSVAVSCSGSGQGIRYALLPTASFYQDLGGARCSARLTIDAKFLPSAFLEKDQGGFFQAPLTQIRRAFTFCETDSCEGFPMLVDDWGLTNLNNEGAECEVSSLQTGICANRGYFFAGRKIYETHRDAAGTKSTADFQFVQQTMNLVPKDLDTTKEYQMSFRGEESDFKETLEDLNEGRPDWETTPFKAPWKDSYEGRKEDFLGR